MTTELAVMDEESQLCSAFSRRSLTPVANRVLKDQVARDLSNDEYEVFLRFCESRALNPWTKQIYAIVRNGERGRQVAYQTSVAGYYSIASRTNHWEGQTPVEWCGPDGVWTDVWLHQGQKPSAARIGIYRKGFRAPLYATAIYSEFSQNTPLWGKMPAHMLAKCAKTMALREAFPEELGDIHCEGAPLPEMAEAYPEKVKPTAPEPKSPKAYKDFTDAAKKKFPGTDDETRACLRSWLETQEVTPAALLAMEIPALKLLTTRLKEFGAFDMDKARKEFHAKVTDLGVDIASVYQYCGCQHKWVWSEAKGRFSLTESSPESITSALQDLQSITKEQAAKVFDGYGTQQ